MARFGFTMEEEFVTHWNTFHLAVMPQFVCQHPGCGPTFAANPGSLDRFLTHITRRREESTTHVPLGRRHPFLPDTDAVTLKPNPYYRLPNKHNEIP